MAYNEEANIASVIRSVLAQETVQGRIAEVIVVASGCTDRTAAIVQEIARAECRLRLLVQERRLGKASAINVFMEAAHAPLLLMVSADVILRQGAAEALLRHFADPRVGMVGGRPIPVNDEQTFLGHAVHLLWRLHDRVNQEAPKLGEVVAFRNTVPSIPPDTAVDELSIQALVAQLGYRLVYEPDAVVYNQGPTTVRDFLRQRRRIHAGHLEVRDRQGYTAPTMSTLRIVRAVPGSGSFATPRAACWTLGALALEPLARALGRYDHMRRRQHHIWETVATTKGHIPGAAAAGQQSVVVFSIVDFHGLQLELGLAASRHVAERVTHLVTKALEPNAVVALRRSGTIIAMLLADPAEAERVARMVSSEIGQIPLRLHVRQRPVSVRLAFGIIACPQPDEAAGAAAAPLPELSASRAIAG